MSENKESKFTFCPLPGAENLYQVQVEGFHPGVDDVKAKLDKKGKLHNRLVFILDKSGSMGSTFSQLVCPGAKMLYDTLKPDSCEVVLFGQKVDSREVKDSDYFTKEMRKTSLEGATNIAGAHAMAVKNSIAYQKKNPDQRVLFTMVFMSDGADTVNGKRVENMIEESGLEWRSASLNAVFLVVGIGQYSDTRVGMVAKMATETLSSPAADKTTVYYCREPNNLNSVMEQMVQEQKDCVGAQLMQLSFTTQKQDNKANVGFLGNILMPVTAQLAVRPTQRADGSLSFSFLFQGNPATLSSFSVNSKPVKFAVSELAPSVEDRMALFQTFAQQIRVGAVARKDIEPALKTVSAFTHQLKLEMGEFNVEDLKKSSAQERVKVMRRMRGVQMEIDGLLNQLRDQALLAKEKMNNEQAAQWLNSAVNMKYGARVLAMAKSAESSDLIDDVQRVLTTIEKDKYEVVDDEMDWQSFMSVMNGSEHLMQLEEVKDLDNPSVTELLYAVGMVGNLIRVRRSEASNISPWMLHVEYVSCDKLDSASALVALDAGRKLEDMGRREGSDILLLVNPRHAYPYRMFMRTRLFETYTSIVFTRNPNLFLGTQPTALLMLALVRLIGQLGQSATAPDTATVAHVQTALHLIYTIRDRLGRGVKEGYWVDLAQKFFLQDPGQYMTERGSDDIQSVAKIWAALCVMDHSTNLFLGKPADAPFAPTMKKKEEKEKKEEKKEGEEVEEEEKESYEQCKDPSNQAREVVLSALGESVSRVMKGMMKNAVAKLVSAPGVSMASPPNEDDIVNKYLRVALGVTKDDKQVLAALNPDEEEDMGPEKEAEYREKEMKLNGKFKVSEVIENTKTLISKMDKSIPFSELLQTATSSFAFARSLHTQLVPECVRALKNIKQEDGKEQQEGEKQGLDALCRVMELDTVKYSLEDRALVASTETLARTLKTAMDNEATKPLTELLAIGQQASMLQTAVVLQALRYRGSQNRTKALKSLSDPMAVLEELVAEQRRLVLQEKLAVRREAWRLKEAERLAYERKMRKLQEQKEFFHTHPGPWAARTFTAEEVKALNADRPKNDKIVLNKSGLPRHHCSFPECKMYLQNLQKESDQASGRRDGLYYHLRAFFWPVRTYVRSFHQDALRLVRSKPKISLAEFVETMMATVKIDVKDLEKQGEWKSNLDNLLTQLKAQVNGDYPAL